MGESATLVRNLLRSGAALVPPGGFGVVDVRDVADAHARLFSPGLGPRRCLLGGRWVAYRTLIERLGEVTGRRIRMFPVPRALALLSGRLADAAQRRGIDLGSSYAQSGS